MNRKRPYPFQQINDDTPNNKRHKSLSSSIHLSQNQGAHQFIYDIDEKVNAEHDIKMSEISNKTKKKFSILQLLVAKELWKCISPTSGLPIFKLEDQMMDLLDIIKKKYANVTFTTPLRPERKTQNDEPQQDEPQLDEPQQDEPQNDKLTNDEPQNDVAQPKFLLINQMFIELLVKEEHQFGKGYGRKNYQQEHGNDLSKIKLLLYNFIDDKKLLKCLEIFDQKQLHPNQFSHESKKPFTSCLFNTCGGVLICDGRNAPAIQYTENGVSTAIMRAHRCNKCKSIFKHNWIHCPSKGRYFFNPNNAKYWEASRECVISTKLFTLFGKTTFKDGMGAQNYSDLFNEQFEEQIDLFNTKSGHHGSAELNPQTLSHSFYFWSSLKILFDHKIKIETSELENDIPYYFVPYCEYHPFKKSYKLNQKLVAKEKFRYLLFEGKIIKKDFIPEFCVDEEKWNLIKFPESIGTCDGTYFGKDYLDELDQKDEEIKNSDNENKNNRRNNYLFIKSSECSHKLKSDKECVATKTDSELYFKFIFNKDLKNVLFSLKNNIALVVPTGDDGEPSLLSQQWYGDGNQKITNFLCNISSNVHKLLNHNKQCTDHIQPTYHQCDHSPYNGNNYTISTKLCIEHWIYLYTRTSLKKNEIDEFISYWNLLHNHKYSTSEKKKAEYMAQLEKIGDIKRERYQNIFKKLQQMIWMQEERRCCAIAGAKGCKKLMDWDKLNPQPKKNHQPTYGIIYMYNNLYDTHTSPLAHMFINR